MRKPTSVIDYSELESGFYDDYESEQMKHDAVQSLESVDKWLYLGADISNSNWAKIGITLGDLRSRSYSSANPNFYIFCAFKFEWNVTKEQIRRVEMELLNMFDKIFTDRFGNPNRLRHYESRKLSECYYPVDFSYFLDNLHNELFHNYSRFFVICGYENEIGDVDGATVMCEFSPTLDIETIRHLRNRLMQW